METNQNFPLSIITQACQQIKTLRWIRDHSIGIMTKSNLEPRIYYKATNHQRWKQAMEHKMNFIYKNGTWTITNLLPSKFAISTK